ncbi:hypothetical protein CAPTEDRAFT_210559 [Capitella teleta]|uniref:Uncharacterized protein n=1 Tax=Capitella teleta TaxID=283909 RepID=R7T9D5_CAPTE|nr:hypothetical protein CAPTEDRAFT_210559 [Capitella teleta]|eukprot:ELT90333.1 hypothetical protein CAPTEDRAFT_210559 [Capitella teleta]
MAKRYSNAGGGSMCTLRRKGLNARRNQGLRNWTKTLNESALLLEKVFNIKLYLLAHDEEMDDKRGNPRKKLLVIPIYTPRFSHPKQRRPPTTVHLLLTNESSDTDPDAYSHAHRLPMLAVQQVVHGRVEDEGSQRIQAAWWEEVTGSVVAKLKKAGLSSVATALSAYGTAISCVSMQGDLRATVAHWNEHIDPKSCGRTVLRSKGFYRSVTTKDGVNILNWNAYDAYKLEWSDYVCERVRDLDSLDDIPAMITALQRDLDGMLPDMGGGYVELFRGNVSLPNIARYMGYKSAEEGGHVFYLPKGPIDGAQVEGKIHSNMAGGPSVVYDRVVDGRKVLTFDANSLYAWAFSQDMPFGRRMFCIDRESVFVVKGDRQCSMGEMAWIDSLRRERKGIAIRTPEDTPTSRMTSFWNTHKEAYLRDVEEMKKAEVEKAKRAAEEAKLDKKATKETDLSVKAPPAVYVEDEDDPDDDDDDDGGTPPVRQTKRRTPFHHRRRPAKLVVHRDSPTKAAKVTKRASPYSRSDSDYDTDMDDDELVTEGKSLASIRDMDKVYPLLNSRSKVAVRKGLVNMVSGGFRDHLTTEERKKIASCKRDYEKVCSRRRKRNPFEGKRKHVGEKYQKFMSEVNVVKDDDSSSTSSEEGEGGSDRLDWTKWD